MNLCHSVVLIFVKVSLKKGLGKKVPQTLHNNESMQFFSYLQNCYIYKTVNLQNLLSD